MWLDNSNGSGKAGRFLRVHTVAKLLDVSKSTVYRLIDNGALESIRTSERNIRISEPSLENYLNKINPELI